MSITRTTRRPSNMVTATLRLSLLLFVMYILGMISGCFISANAQEVVHIERHVLCSKDYLNDPSILISTPKVVNKPVVVEQIRYIEKIVPVIEKPEEDVKVTTSWSED